MNLNALIVVFKGAVRLLHGAFRVCKAHRISVGQAVCENAS